MWQSYDLGEHQVVFNTAYGRIHLYNVLKKVRALSLVKLSSNIAVY